MRSYTQKYANPSIKGLRVLWLWRRTLTSSPNYLKFQQCLSTSMGIFSAPVCSGFKQILEVLWLFFPPEISNAVVMPKAGHFCSLQRTRNFFLIAKKEPKIGGLLAFLFLPGLKQRLDIRMAQIPNFQKLFGWLKHCGPLPHQLNTQQVSGPSFVPS